MKRELKCIQPKQYECCPGHDDWPCDSYKNRRSKRARSRDKKKEHKLARTLVKRALAKEII